MALEFSWQIFEKSSSVKFHENPSNGRLNCCVRTDGQTYRQTDELIVAFCNFEYEPKYEDPILGCDTQSIGNLFSTFRSKLSTLDVTDITSPPPKHHTPEEQNPQIAAAWKSKLAQQNMPWRVPIIQTSTITNTMKYKLYWKAGSGSSDKEMTRHLWNPKFSDIGPSHEPV